MERGLELINNFLQSLVLRARLGLHGEKPLAVLATLRYLSSVGSQRLKLSELLDNPTHSSRIKRLFLDLASQYGEISNPSNSWSVITGRARELQRAAESNSLTDQAFSSIGQDEAKALYEQWLSMLQEGQSSTQIPFRTTESSQFARSEPIAELNVLSINGGRELVGALFEEINQAVSSAIPPNHQGIVSSLAREGWSTEVSLLGGYRCDAYKDGVVIEVESVDKSSVIDVLHRDFFRFLMLLKMKRIRTAVLVTRIAGGEISLEKVKSDLKIYGDYYEVPLLVIGI